MQGEFGVFGNIKQKISARREGFNTFNSCLVSKRSLGQLFGRICFSDHFELHWQSYENHIPIVGTIMECGGLAALATSKAMTTRLGNRSDAKVFLAVNGVRMELEF